MSGMGETGTRTTVGRMQLMTKTRKADWSESRAALETALFAARASGDETSASEDVATLTALDDQLYKTCNQHLKSCLPSMFREIGRSRGNMQKRFRYLLHELNQCFPVPARLPRIIFDDKFVFESVLKGLGIPTPHSHWLISGAEAVNLESGQFFTTESIVDSLLDQELFVKARIGRGGRTAFLLRNSTLVNPTGESAPVSADDLLKILGKPGSGYILQERVSQSEELSRLSPTSLNTIRCLTYLDRDGRAHVIGATVRMGTGAGVVDNASAGGIFCGIDLHRHCLIASAKNKSRDSFDKHPTSGIVFDGYPISLLREAFDLCTRTHGFIGSPVTIGWDVAMSESGPIIIEGNTRWMSQLHWYVDPNVAPRAWSLYLDDWGKFSFGYDQLSYDASALERKSLVSTTLSVTGKVQGVGYRRWVARQAKERELAGSASNNTDGSVTVRLAGPIHRIQACLLTMTQGPARARVSSITAQTLDIESSGEFQVDE